MSSGVELAVPVEGDAGLAAPDLSQSARLTLEQWGGTGAIAWGCVRGDVSQWSDDATDVAQGKLTDLASSTLERMRGEATPMHVVASHGRERTLDADDVHVTAHARTLLAFTEGQAHGCFVVCAAADCDAMKRTVVVGELREPPPAGAMLRSVGFVMHHPHGAMAILGGAIVASAALAIVKRPRRFPR
jgi:hypothetical protein